MKFWNKMKKNSKGFTLVEIIVVLVILAVLAAFTIPTMLGFVNDARGKALIAEAREVYVAAQATATEYMAQDSTITDATMGTSLSSAAVGATSSAPTGASATMLDYLLKDFATIATTKPANTAKGSAYWVVTVGANDANATAKVSKVEYTKDGYTVTITSGGGSTVVKY